MFDKLAGLDTRYNQLSEQMAQPDVATDHVRLQQIAREQRKEKRRRAERNRRKNAMQLH